MSQAVLAVVFTADEVARVAALSAAIHDEPAQRRLKLAPASVVGADFGRPVAISSMFSTAPGAAVRGRPLITAAVIGAMAVVLVVVAAMANRGHIEPATVAGDTVGSIDAVVSAFNRAGAFVTSAQAPLDLLTLGPGEESPFVVTIPNVGDVGRYRVSFRTDSGVVRHVDRRATQIARAVVAN
ncbi:MAG: hypothetical protein FJW14_01840 [Acidimicrobiia bacterium]|nr:hypothetical protein [Acidimicrobiia bacterium]